MARNIEKYFGLTEYKKLSESKINTRSKKYLAQLEHKSIMKEINKRYVSGDILSCLPLLRKAVKLVPRDPNAFYLLGLIHEENKNYEKALISYVTTAILKKNDTSMWKKVFEMSQHTNNYKHKILAIDKIHKKSPREDLIHQKIQIYKDLKKKYWILACQIELFDYQGIDQRIFEKFKKTKHINSLKVVTSKLYRCINKNSAAQTQIFMYKTILSLYFIKDYDKIAKIIERFYLNSFDLEPELRFIYFTSCLNLSEARYSDILDLKKLFNDNRVWMDIKDVEYVIDFALFFKNKNNLSTSISIIENLIKFHRSLRILEFLGDLYKFSNELEKALQCYQTIISEDPLNETVKPKIHYIYNLKGNDFMSKQFEVPLKINSFISKRDENIKNIYRYSLEKCNKLYEIYMESINLKDENIWGFHEFVKPLIEDFKNNPFIFLKNKNFRVLHNKNEKISFDHIMKISNKANDQVNSQNETWNSKSSNRLNNKRNMDTHLLEAGRKFFDIGQNIEEKDYSAVSSPDFPIPKQIEIVDQNTKINIDEILNREPVKLINEDFDMDSNTKSPKITLVTSNNMPRINTDAIIGHKIPHCEYSSELNDNFCLQENTIIDSENNGIAFPSQSPLQAFDPQNFQNYSDNHLKKSLSDKFIRITSLHGLEKEEWFFVIKYSLFSLIYNQKFDECWDLLEESFRAEIFKNSKEMILNLFFIGLKIVLMTENLDNLVSLASKMLNLHGLDCIYPFYAFLHFFPFYSDNLKFKAFQKAIQRIIRRNYEEKRMENIVLECFCPSYLQTETFSFINSIIPTNDKLSYLIGILNVSHTKSRTLENKRDYAIKGINSIKKVTSDCPIKNYNLGKVYHFYGYYDHAEIYYNKTIAEGCGEIKKMAIFNLSLIYRKNKSSKVLINLISSSNS